MKQIANILLTLFALLGINAYAAHKQLILVVADDMNQSTALLQRYEQHDSHWEKIGLPVPVNLGRNGLGWGIGLSAVAHTAADPLKHEGDGRAPAGIFALGPVFGYASSMRTAMPYLQATDDLICIDDSRSPAYNKVVHIAPSLRFGSFEWMRREDGLYRIGIVVQHNSKGLKGRGSCIFMHIERAPGSGTAGCTSMNEKDLAAIVRWLDPDKQPVLIQIPAKSLSAIQKEFDGIGR